MNSTSLKYFLVAAQEENITKAAARLYLSQQSLSEHIARLENEYDVKLFERTPRLKLTSAGKRLILLAQQMLDLEEETFKEMSAFKANKRETLVIGIRPSYSRILIPLFLHAFSQSHPLIDLSFHIGPSQELARRVLDNQLELCIVSARFAGNSKLSAHKIYDDSFCIVIPENLLLAHDTNIDETLSRGLSPELLKSLPFTLPSPGGVTRQATEHFLTFHEIDNPRIVMETEDLETASIMSVKGFGATVSYRRFIVYLENSMRLANRLYIADIPSPPGISTSLWICHRARKVLSPAAEDFLELANEVGRTL